MQDGAAIETLSLSAGTTGKVQVTADTITAQTQLQIIQGDKMSTLGQLVAGIGHEINNPVGTA